ncbi:GNAT family N-acetyltransferase, partial [Alphaproteobacteria bacterium]|nr:GNAT family N-acetyltransferase [Alphaproteobacteria bacterium]
MEVKSYEIIPDTIWDDFCLNNSQGWFWHSSFRIKHALNASKDFKSTNKSFGIFYEKKLISIVPLVHDYDVKEKISLFTFGGFGTPVPLVDDNLSNENKKKIYKKIYSKIDELAVALDIKKIHIFQPTSYPFKILNNISLKYGYSDISSATQILNLENKELFNEVTKNHKRAIKKADNILDVKIYNSKNITENIFKKYKDFYKIQAGTSSRPDMIYELAYKYLKNDLAVLGIAKFNNNEVGYVLVIYYKQIGYFLNSAMDKQFDKCPVSHLIHWKIIKYLQEKNIKIYELGLQEYTNNFNENPTKK